MDKKPIIGVGIIIIKDNKILLGKRKTTLGKGHWAFPGGALEFKEEIEDCARREVIEETGLKIKNLKRGPIANCIFDDDSHILSLVIVADHDSGELINVEPDKCEGWQWFEWNNLPEPLFLPTKKLKELNFDPFKQ